MAESTTSTEAPSKAQLERKKHGSESAAQLIGHLGTPKKDVRKAVLVPAQEREDGTSRQPYIWTTLAVNKGKDFDPSWLFINIYGTANDDGMRPSVEDMQAMADLLATGQRVKCQGPIEVRQGDLFDTPEGQKRDQSTTIKLFMAPEDVAHVLDADNLDAAGRRPLTLLPRIGNDNAGPDVGF